VAAAIRSGSVVWLFGSVPDLLFGCGLLYALLFGVFLLSGAEIRTAQPGLVFPLLILGLSVPHYGATLLRVYEQRRDRRAYVFFSLWATLAFAALFVGGLHLPALGSFLVTLYLTWSPWHYTGQNYGLAVMFLRRSGVTLDAGTKRWIHLSFVLSFVLVFIEMHAAVGEMADLPVGYTSDQGASFVSLGIPPSWALTIAPPLLAAYLAALAVSALRLRRSGSWRALLPAALLATSQLLWFSLPYGLHLLGIAPQLDPLSWKFRSHYFTWIAAAHALQYLWVTAYYARRSQAWRGQLPQYAKALAAGAAPWTLPFVVFGPQALGPLSADAGLAMLVASVVNLHHFVLDGAIWKLKGRIAEVLIRSGSDEDRAAAVPRRIGLRHAVWATCALALALHALHYADRELVQRRLAQGDLPGALAAGERLARTGLESSALRLNLGQGLLEAGRTEEARAELERSIALLPRARAHLLLARIHQQERRFAEAAESYETALALGLAAGREAPTAALAASAWLSAGQPERARRVLARVPAHDPRFRELIERVGAAAAPRP
jgi:tetratricopeptide (TPR) repeat protein